MPEHGETFDTEDDLGGIVKTRVITDRTRTVINRVDSPDIAFDWTINPYRGCEHGCTYCYARPFHEYLGLSAGLDFETTIVAKRDAPELLERELGRASWGGEPIVMSGITDPYQPIERRLRITRGILERCRARGQPVSFITKSRLICRDLDLLAPMAAAGRAQAGISLTTLDPELSRDMEPRAASPSQRLETVRRLADAGVAVRVMTAPIIPGLNDRELPALLEAAADAGASSAGYVLLRLPHGVKDIFLEWLDRTRPLARSRVESFIRASRGGKLYDAHPGAEGNQRRAGRGPMAEQIKQMFMLHARRCGLPTERASLAPNPAVSSTDPNQPTLF